MNTDHSGINKFFGSNDENSVLVEAEIRRISQLASPTIESRYRSRTPQFSIHKEKDLFHVPFSLKGIPVMDKFVGHDAELTRLAQLMISSPTDDIRRKMCVLHGIGGLEKSQVQ